MRRLHPDGAAITVEQAVDELALGENAPADRPYVVANMVATADGHATIGGRSGPLGGEADRALFHALRGRVEAVMAGTGTLRAERYGRLVRDSAAREARAARGLAPDPIAFVVTRSGRLPLDIPLFQDPGSTVAVYSASAVEAGDCPATVHVTRLAESSMGAAVRALSADHGVRSLLCEGGPTVLGALVREGLVDELFLTVAPLLAAGEPALPTVTGQAFPHPARLRLRWVLESEDELMLRYQVDASGRAPAAPAV